LTPISIWIWNFIVGISPKALEFGIYTIGISPKVLEFGILLLEFSQNHWNLEFYYWNFTNEL
jgi:hypothetical protein